jgi:hypothetical protein
LKYFWGGIYIILLKSLEKYPALATCTSAAEDDPFPAIRHAASSLFDQDSG